MQNDAPRRNDLGKIVEIPDVSGKHTRTQLPRLQENQSIVDKPTLVTLTPWQVGQPKEQASEDAGLPPDSCVRGMKSVLRYVAYRRLNCFQDRLR